MTQKPTVARELGSLNARVEIIEADVNEIKESQKRIEHSLIDSKGRLKGGVAVVAFLITVVGGIAAYFAKS